MKSSTGHAIKHRQKPNDVFITPRELAKSLIDKYHTPCETDVWLDPFAGLHEEGGSFITQFPKGILKKRWCEIRRGKDFFTYNKPVDTISSNPPYSLMDKVLEHTFKICRKEFGYLIGVHNLTPRRIEMCNNAGFYIKSFEMFKVYKWYGMSCYVVFSRRIEDNIINFNRKVWR